MRTFGSERGQAVTETMLVTWLLLVFMAAMWQLFIANDTVFRSIAAARVIAFTRAYERNKVTVDYGREQVTVIWSRPDMPEAEIPVINMFKGAVGARSIPIVSNVNADRHKRTRVGSGTAGPAGGAGIGRYYTHTFEVGRDVLSADFFQAYYRRLGG